MKILIAEDEPISRRRLEAALAKWGYEALVTRDGTEAWEVLQGESPPPLVLLDWIMPGMDGVEVCKKVRMLSDSRHIYIILLTTKGLKDDIIEGLGAGADDYITKPFDFDELHARIQVGIRVVSLQEALASRVKEVEKALLQVRKLEGLLPICSYCKRIRDDRNYWQQVENYVADRSEVRFSHSICPDCMEKVIQPQLSTLSRKKETNP